MTTLSQPSPSIDILPQFFDFLSTRKKREKKRNNHTKARQLIRNKHLYFVSLETNMQSTFATKKREILQQLAEPEGSYANLPVRRSIDVGIRELVDEINDMETLVTTSSCAGRIAVYLESRPSQQSLSTSTSTSTSTTVNSIDTQHLPIDGGQWLFVSHDPLPLSGMGSVAPVLGFSDHTDLTFPSDVEGMRWVRCKFEPMVM
jgi:tRNA wybutosine-synthesizing protein 3